MDEQLYWHCVQCGDHDALTAEDVENGYEFGDKERCIACGEGTHYVWPSDICAAFGQLRALGVGRSAAIQLAQDRYTDVRKARAEGEKALASALATARAEGALAEREACASIAATDVDKYRAALQEIRPAEGIEYQFQMGRSLAASKIELAIRARTTPATLSTETLAAIAEARGLRVVKARAEVIAFAEAMEAQLTKNEHKGGWKDDSALDLHQRIWEELEELHAELMKRRERPGRANNQELILSEAADVANFAMMVADVCGGFESRTKDGAK